MPCLRGGADERTRSLKFKLDRFFVGDGFIWAAVNGDIPVTAIFTSASVHDSSVALPLIKETSGKLDYLYDLFFYRVFCLIFGWWGLLGGY